MEPRYSELYNKKKSTAKLGHSGLLSVCKSIFTQMPISNLSELYQLCVTIIEEEVKTVFHFP